MPDPRRCARCARPIYPAADPPPGAFDPSAVVHDVHGRFCVYCGDVHERRVSARVAVDALLSIGESLRALCTLHEQSQRMQERALSMMAPPRGPIGVGRTGPARGVSDAPICGRDLSYPGGPVCDRAPDHEGPHSTSPPAGGRGFG